MRKYLLGYIKENMKMITILSICILLGILSGIMLYNFSSAIEKEEFIKTVKSVFDISKQENFEGVNIIVNGIKTNLILTVLIYFSSLIIICPIFISALNYIKGISIGIYIPIIFSVFGTSNFLIPLLLIIILPNIFCLPAYVLLSTNALNIHYIIMERNKKSKIKLFVTNISYIIIGVSFIFLSILLEQIFSGTILSIYKGL